MEWIQGKFKIVDDSTEIDIDVVSRLLAGTYWGPWRARTVITDFRGALTVTVV
jgi:hypothetical protein